VTAVHRSVIVVLLDDAVAHPGRDDEGECDGATAIEPLPIAVANARSRGQAR
jgi:hypothetical protein